MKLISIIVPVFNEKYTIIKILEKINNEVKKLSQFNFEIIIVDDCSLDGTVEILKNNNFLYQKILFGEKNLGKGYAVKRGIEISTGEIILIQDADLEYLPENYYNLITPFVEIDADVVYGSRFRTTHCNRVLFFWHYVANTLITFLSNLFSNLNFSDVEVGFKLFKSEVLKKIKIEENSFGIEIELTHKLSRIRPRLKFYEVGISYNARDYSEGKKIGIKDAFRAIYCIFKYSFK